jgi:hypothetical protein
MLPLRKQKEEILTKIITKQRSIYFPGYNNDDALSESDIDGENLDTEDIEKGGDDDRNIDNTEENLVSKQQNYPNSFGLSFVVGK